MQRNVLSRILLPTAKKQSSKSGIAPESSHELLVRAGFIRQSGAAGLFTLLPFGLRVLRKLEKLIDEEMAEIGAQKVVRASSECL